MMHGLDAYPLMPPVRLFPLAHSGVTNRTWGVDTGAGRFIWKLYQTHARAETIHYEHRLLAWLADQGLPFATPAPATTRSGETVLATEEGYRALFPMIPGSRPDHRAPVQVRAVGAALSVLHRTLARHPPTPRPGMAGFLELGQFAGPDAADIAVDMPGGEDLAAWWRQELADLEAWIQHSGHGLPRQVIHGDFGPGNTLWAKGRITGVLDFDFAGPDVRAMDLASGLTFCMRLWENPEPWPAVEAFSAGYAQENRLTQEEIAALPWLMRLRNAVSALWRLGRGQVTPALERIVESRRTARWLTVHGPEFVRMAGAASE